MKKNPYNRTLRTPAFFRINTPPDLWAHIYGVSSFIGLIITIILTIYAYNNKSDREDFQFVLIALLATLISVLLLFLISVAYFNRRIKQLGEIPYNYHFFKEEYEKQEIIINQITECSHIVAHYFRNLDLSLQEILDSKEADVSVDDLVKVIDKFDYFLINITTNLQSYYSQITDDNCSITIKLLRQEESGGTVARTYFRDPVNFKKRKESDDFVKKCYVSDNTAFSIIMDPSYSNIYFAEDDLPDLYKRHSYKNPNPYWYKFYKSNLVVPISIVTGENERKILGFLSVDNFKGGLAVNANKEYLFFVADLLYLGFNKFHRIVEIAKRKDIRNEKIKRYASWD